MAGTARELFAVKILYWNRRGFGRAATIRHLKQVVRQHQPEIICLAEKVLETRSSFQSMGFSDGFEIPPRGTSGGLAITWQIVGLRNSLLIQSGGP